MPDLALTEIKDFIQIMNIKCLEIIILNDIQSNGFDIIYFSLNLHISFLICDFKALSYFCNFAVGFLNANISHFVDCKSFSLQTICEGVKTAKTTILHSYLIGSLSLILITYIGIVIEINHIIPSI